MEEKAKQKITFEEFKEIEKNSEKQMEFIDGEIFFHAAPSSAHQIVARNISTVFGNYFKDKPCKHMVAPYDIVLRNDYEPAVHKVQPDISVLCEKDKVKENFYEGVPTLIVEILSPSTASKDFIKKMDLYMRFGVKEYWIVSPKNKNIQVFNLDEGTYSEPIEYLDKQKVISSVFLDLEMNVAALFEW